MTNTLPVRRVHFKEGKYTCPVIPIPIPQQTRTAITSTIRSPRLWASSCNSIYPYTQPLNRKPNKNTIANPYARGKTRVIASPTRKIEGCVVETKDAFSVWMGEENPSEENEWQYIVELIAEKKQLYQMPENE